MWKQYLIYKYKKLFKIKTRDRMRQSRGQLDSEFKDRGISYYWDNIRAFFLCIRKYSIRCTGYDRELGCISYALDLPLDHFDDALFEIMSSKVVYVPAPARSKTIKMVPRV